MASKRLDLENRTAYRFAMLADASMQCLSDMFRKKFGLTVPAWQVLSVIGRFEPMNPSDVASRTSMQADKVTRTVDKLVQAGLLVRGSDSEDRRRIVLKLTAKGRSTFDAIDHVRRLMENEFLSVLGKQEQRAFLASLDKLEAHGRKIYGDRERWLRLAMEILPN